MIFFKILTIKISAVSCICSMVLQNITGSAYNTVITITDPAKIEKIHKKVQANTTK